MHGTDLETEAIVSATTPPRAAPPRSFVKHEHHSVSVPGGVARLVSRQDLAGNEAWRRAFAARGKDHRYYEILEETLLDGFEHHYLVMEDFTGKVRGVQPVFFVRQNLTEGMAGRMRAIINAARRKFPRFLTMRIMMVGCVAGEGHLGACAAEDETWVAAALRASLHALAKRHRASLVVLKDFPASYRAILSDFSSDGYARVPSMPLTGMALHYGSFEEYLATLGSATRKNLRRKFRQTAQAAPIALEVVTDITPHVEEIYPLYEQVHARSPMKFETLTKEYFCRVGTEMPERARFFMWRQNGRIIAFSFALVHNDTFYDECLGLDYRVALDLHLYYYTIRDIISWALEQGLKFYCSSPLNYDPKLHLGCHLVPLDLYVRHMAPVINPLFRYAVKYLEPTRHDPVLRQFPNAAEL
jgi:predicted N-acyltransferase